MVFENEDTSLGHLPDGHGTLEMESLITRVQHVVVENEEEPSPSNIASSSSPGTLHPSECAISYEQLVEVDREAKAKWGEVHTKTMRDVVRHIIVPYTKTAGFRGLSYAQTKNPNGRKLDAFVTHCWDEPFREFVNSIRNVCSNQYHKPNLWVCAFALAQGDHGTIEKELNVPLADSPFVRALEEAKSFIVVRNTVTDLYERSWCVCELLYATKQENNLFPHHTYITGPNSFADSDFRCENARAHNLADQARILGELENHGVNRINEIIRQFREFNDRESSRDELLCKFSKYSMLKSSRIMFTGLVAGLLIYLMARTPPPGPSII